MKKIKETVKFEKENMPQYQYDFLYKRILPGMIYIVGGALVSIILAIIMFLTTEFRISSNYPCNCMGNQCYSFISFIYYSFQKDRNTPITLEGRRI